MPKPPRRLAKERGRANEYRTAELLGGYVYAGQDGDVVAGDTIVECKYRGGYRFSGATLRSWLEQAKANAAHWATRGEPKHWLIEVYGGRGTERIAILSLSRYKELCDELAAYQREYGPRPASRGDRSVVHPEMEVGSAAARRD